MPTTTWATAWTTSHEHRPGARHARFSAGGRAAPPVRDRRDRRRLSAVRLRAARDPVGREHRDPARQVRRRRRQADLQDPEARGRRRDGAGRPRAALRPHRAAGAGGRRVPRESCRSSSSATRCSRCGARTVRRRGASASSTSATSTRSDRRRWWWKPNCLGAACEVLSRLGFADLHGSNQPSRSCCRRCSTAREVPTAAESDDLVAADKLDKVGRGRRHERTAGEIILPAMFTPG